MSDDEIIIEVDGQSIPARKGAMLIEATDDAGIYIPRFCYHKHLSVAANCRMCLVEVERAPKPLPACATPVMDGMKVSTSSAYAVDAQRSTMEFLLINHPLDCPICDQGGECELQDLAMGYGGDVSRYAERKRVVRDKNIGPLVQTDMTRCIHCTRCVRFGEEIAGLRELGATGRGEDMEIGTYVAKAMGSELSGNVIDLCPVGALTSKPYRYSARAWELQQRDGIAPHDCLGSNLHFHIKGSIVKRVVPKDNSAVNETWLADRDRFSYEALSSEDRLLNPRIKHDGVWRDCDWGEALDAVAENLTRINGQQPGSVAALASPSSTTEEFYLLQRLVRELGGNGIDHRPRQLDFSGDSSAPLAPGLNIELEALEQADVIVLVGSYPRHDQPLINHRIRKAALRGGKVIVINPLDYEFNFALDEKIIVPPSQLRSALGAIAKQLDAHAGMNDDDRRAIDSYTSANVHTRIAEKLRDAKTAVIISGNFAQRDKAYGQLSALCSIIGNATGATVATLTEGANSAGAWLAGAVPHRGPGGRSLAGAGYDAKLMFDMPAPAYVLVGLEPTLDCVRSRKVMDALRSAYVVALATFRDPSLEDAADVMLPMAAFAENEGCYVNALGHWQHFSAAVRAPGEARPGWKLIRAMGEKLSLAGFDCVTCADVTSEIAELCDSVTQPAGEVRTAKLDSADSASTVIESVVEIPMYAADPLVRRATALQAAPQADRQQVFVNQATAAELGLGSGDQARIDGDGEEIELTVALDESVLDGSILVYGAHADAGTVSDATNIQISKAS